MNRRQIIQATLLAGYHSNEIKLMQLSGLNVISSSKSLAAYRHGAKAKLKGIKCDCKTCQKKP